MDLLRKVEALLNATARAGLPRRRRRSPLDEEETRVINEVRQALAEVEVRERQMAERLKTEHVQAAQAAQRGDRAEQQAHEQRAAELERHLERESIQAINLEEKLAALEEKLALAREAVDKQAQAAALEDEKHTKTMAKNQGSSRETQAPTGPASPQEGKEIFSDDPPDLANRKSRLSD